ncbi:MAG: sugar phosphate isomerase/epimerase [Gammaproteobacteria bacterium]|nr:sugar phosphate isomerase/epimerase [Gammaproteobacteria bacterium]
MDVRHFGMDTITLAGSLDAKLRAVKAAGFSQIMLSARDIAEYAAGPDAAVAAVRESGLRVTGFQVLRDFEGLDGHLRDYKTDIAKAMLQMCHQVGSKVLLVCSSTSAHATDKRERLVQDLQALAMLAVPLNIRIAYEALSWGRFVNELPQAWEIVVAANRSNLGIGIDSFHILATQTALDEVELLDPDRIFLVQLSDFMWQETRSPEERITTARHFRVFPGEGVHSENVYDLVRRLESLGYRGDYSFEVFNDDYVQLPHHVVTRRALRSAQGMSGMLNRRGVPLTRTAAAHQARYR